ncbi:hypothetical protein PIB30_063665 [Stylosanthes scabra]|uniref:Uncharacterized protein n=1 Tax=Stylosanthes scabra TaxID=79078 RepID=A0ABU6QNG6_9FABA|nr:hypothetical protein [Stylosanthes scabra]
MPGRIPRWFEQRSRGASISFWFRGKDFPGNALLVAIRLRDGFHCNLWPIKVTPIVIINGDIISFTDATEIEQLFVFDLSRITTSLCLENRWNHVMVSYKAQLLSWTFKLHDVQIESVAKEIGIHLLKQKRSSIMQDIRFTDPYKMTQPIVMMMMVLMVLPNHKNQPLLLQTRIGLWTLLFLTHTALGTNTLT